ncbi:probable multidrug resistance-associated protein lethal(2)03659 isoform X2 [Photinus pyralis]|nr:probable multidrug resistance-associated protein lethal(2)03659 isoform X2 [Photinus pyralis]
MMDWKSKSIRPTNPRKNANAFCVPTFLFTLPIFFKGWRKELTEADVYEPLSGYRARLLGEKLEQLWREEVEKCKKSKATPTLRNQLIRAFWFEGIVNGLVLMVVEVIVKPLQCVLIGRLITVVSSVENVGKHELYMYGAGMACCSLITSSLIHPYLLAVHNLGLKLRIACISLVYRKILRLKLSEFEGMSSGKILTLVTNDSNRFYEIPLLIHYMLVAVLQIAVVGWFLYKEFGISSLIGVFFIISFVGLYYLLGTISKRLRSKILTKTDERVRVTKEIIYGIQVLKMYKWEGYFSNLVSECRRFEIRFTRISSYVKGMCASFQLFVLRTSVFATILAFVLLGNDITAAKAFQLVSFYAILRAPIVSFLPKAIYVIMESVIPLERLSEFLRCDETQKDSHARSDESGDAIILRNVFVQKASTNLLSDINVSIGRGRLVVIVGPVGCGKTSLAHAILNEMSLSSGSITVSGSVSYASQEPWIFTSTVRQNIIFGNKIDKQRYDNVVKACALSRDLKLFPHHDQTIVGEHGASLSGGQKARIGLARAVYRNADIYILDDPLSAVDSRVGKSIFHDCFKSLLKDKTVVLITHQVQYLKAADDIIVLNNGTVTAQGSFSDLVSQNVDFDVILCNGDGEMITECETNPQKVRTTSTGSLVSKQVDAPDTTDEQTTSGAVASSVYKTYFSAGSHWSTSCFVIALFVIAQVLASGSDYFIAYWVNLNQVQTSSVSMPINIFIYIYTTIIFGVIVFVIAAMVTLHSLCMESSTGLHNAMFTSVLGSPLKFFHLNHSGRILNRFSKDLQTIDEELPLMMHETVLMGLMTTGAIVLIAVVNYVSLIPAAIAIVMLYYLRKFYLATSRKLKRIEATTRSPVLGYVNATIEGLSTIRAFNAEQVVLNEFNYHQDLNSSASYMFISTSRAFGYWTDLSCTMFNTCAIFLLLITGNNFGGNIGLTITQSLGLTGILQFVIRQYAEMENAMTSVERVLEYGALEQEPEDHCITPPPNWPEHGKIVFDSISLRYSRELLILNDINLVIKPREKVGIVGRTGAGKSSIINAMFRLSEFSGSITIDGIDTKTVPLCDLRSKISIIPQQPTIFSGSLRNNLDPLDEYSDAILWTALENVELKDTVSNLPFGLNSVITEGGLSFSIGQRQLMCLARAMLRNNKILVLDEATANVDPKTDLLIQTAVRKNFSNCTVLTIAHRLDTVIDSDKILVIDGGKVVEFDHPHVLLQDCDGVFYAMVNQTDRRNVCENG